MATVTVRGLAEADVEPDRVRLVVAVRAEAAAAADALGELAVRSAATTEVLDAAADLLLLRRPSAVSLLPTWSPTGEVTGQAARRTVVVEARADGPLGDLLARLVAVPGTTLEGTDWLVDPGNPGRGRLRAAAVVDARGRAADYARAADLRLGALEWIVEPDASRPPEPGPREMRMDAMQQGGGADGPVLELRPEPVTVSAAVDVRYALLPGPEATS